MNKINLASIRLFCRYFKEHIEEIYNLKCPVMYKKILLASIIDALGKLRYCSTKDRFVAFIDSCSNWSDKDRISVVQLKLKMDVKYKGEAERKANTLYQEIKRRYNEFMPGDILRPQKDPFKHELIKYVRTEDETMFNNTRYAELFYVYRNSLVHEFQQAGRGSESLSNDGSTPYYHYHYSKTSYEWQLVVPLAFFKSLCLKCLIGMKKYLIKNDMDPFDIYKPKDIWGK